MKFLIVLSALVLAVAAEDQYCYSNVTQACKPADNKQDPDLSSCNAVYGGIKKVLPELKQFATKHIYTSFDYLMLSSNFGTYMKNREGFEKVFRKLSDSTWADAINIIKYIAKRGYKHDLQQLPNPKDSVTFDTYALHEIQALSKAVDVQKSLAEHAIKIHKEVMHHNNHDPEVAQYIEEEFAEKHAEEIRKLVGHVSDLSKMLDGDKSSISLYLFDEYLQKS